jgi:hypothetical protein
MSKPIPMNKINTKLYNDNSMGKYDSDGINSEENKKKRREYAENQDATTRKIRREHIQEHQKPEWGG